MTSLLSRSPWIFAQAFSQSSGTRFRSSSMAFHRAGRARSSRMYRSTIRLFPRRGRGKVWNSPSFTGKRRTPKRAVSSRAVPSQPRPSQSLPLPGVRGFTRAGAFFCSQPLPVSAVLGLGAGGTVSPDRRSQPLGFASLRGRGFSLGEALQSFSPAPLVPTPSQMRKLLASWFSGFSSRARRKCFRASSYRSS